MHSSAATINTHRNRIRCGWSRGLKCWLTEPDAPEGLVKSQHPQWTEMPLARPLAIVEQKPIGATSRDLAPHTKVVYSRCSPGLPHGVLCKQKFYQQFLFLHVSPPVICLGQLSWISDDSGPWPRPTEQRAPSRPDDTVSLVTPASHRPYQF